MTLITFAQSISSSTSDGYATEVLRFQPSAQSPECYEFGSTMFNLLDEMLVDIPAHYALEAGVHLAADTTSNYFSGITGPITDYNTAYGLISRIRASVIAHAANETAHTAADAVSFASLPELPDYTVVEDVAALVNAIKDAWNVHIATEGSVHGVADATNVLTASDAAVDTFKFATAQATLTLQGYHAATTDTHQWEVKFGFEFGTSGDLNFIDAVDPVVTVFEKSELGADPWSLDVSVDLKDLVVSVTGEAAKNISWTGYLRYELTIHT